MVRNCRRTVKMNPKGMPVICIGRCVIVLGFCTINPEQIPGFYGIYIVVIFQPTLTTQSEFDQEGRKIFSPCIIFPAAIKITQFLHVSEGITDGRRSCNREPDRFWSNIKIIRKIWLFQINHLKSKEEAKILQ